MLVIRVFIWVQLPIVLQVLLNRVLAGRLKLIIIILNIILLLL